MKTPKTLAELSVAMPQIAAYGIEDIRTTERICAMLEAAHAVVQAAHLCMHDIAMQGNVEARISSRTELQLSNAILRFSATTKE